MLIAIAGTIGAGKSTVAHAVSSQLHLPVHSIDDDKRAVGADHPEFGNWVAQGIPFPDDFRQLVFARTLAQLRDLAPHHPHVIVEETFHRRAVREPFFHSASNILDGILLIEISVEEHVAIAHLARRARSGEAHMAGRAMFEAFRKVSDPIDHADLTVPNNGDLEAAVATVCDFVQARLGS